MNEGIKPKSLTGGIEKLDPDKREKIVNSLRENSDKAFGENLKAATDEEVRLAIEILGLNLPAKDWEPSRHYTFDDSNYKPDVEKRKEMFTQIGLSDEDFKIERHNVVLADSNHKKLNVKIMNLLKKFKDENSRDAFEPVGQGILFLGKLVFVNGVEHYENLTEEDKKFIEKYLEDRPELKTHKKSLHKIQ